MPVLMRRPRAVIFAFGLATAALLCLMLSVSQASASTFTNACKNSVTANNSQINVTMNSSTSPHDPITGGDSITLSGIHQTLSVPGAIFTAGYNLGLLTVGPNTIPATAATQIEGTNTVEGIQRTNFAAGSISTVVHDPDGTPSTGDEFSDDGSLTLDYNNQTWTAAADGPVNFREDTQQPLSVAANAEVGGVVIRAVIGGFLSVRFACSPGTVAPTPGSPDGNPGIPTLTDPAIKFASTGDPTADAGTDQTVDSGASVNLDGTGSSDPNNDTLTYNWTQTSGDPVALSGADTASPSFTAPTGPATLDFQLEVCDSAQPDAGCDTDSVTVNVNAPNTTPTADAGTDQTVDSGASVNLDGTGSSDPDVGQTLSYSWTQTVGQTVSLSGADTATPSFTAPTGPDTLTFELTVCDDSGAANDCATDTVDINVNPPAPNTQPTADAGTDQTVDSGASVNLDGTGSSDPDAGQTLSYSWTQTVGDTVSLSGADTATPSFTAPDGPQTLTFELTVCDDSGAANDCATDTVDIVVRAPNTTPTADAGLDQTVDSGASVNLDGTGSSDPDVGQTLSYSWTQTVGQTVALSGADTATPSFTAPTGPDTLTFELTVCDDSGAANDCATDTVDITVNAPPQVVDISIDAIVNGPTSSRKTSKALVAKVTNLGTGVTTVCDTDVTWDVKVNGVSKGSVTSAPVCKDLNPGASTRLKFTWTYSSADVSAGDTVDYQATVNVTDDSNAGNDSDTETRTAK